LSWLENGSFLKIHLFGRPQNIECDLQVPSETQIRQKCRSSTGGALETAMSGANRPAISGQGAGIVVARTKEQIMIRFKPIGS
jgi:hypothetical protein